MTQPASSAAARGTLSPSPHISIVVPTFREAQNIAQLVSVVDAAMVGIDWELIFVDDDSPDGTIDAIRAIAANNHRIRAIRRLGRRGLSGAAIEGMLSSSAKIVAVMDCDLQHDEKILPVMLAKIESGADIVVGTRYREGGSADGGFTATRKQASQLATWVSNAVLGTDISDPMSGFFMLRREVFESVAPHLSTDGFKILLDLLASRPKGTKLAEVPYSFRARHAGESKLTSRVILEFLCQIAGKMTGARIPPRLIMFLIVGATGVVVHLLALRFALASAALEFAPAQVAASYVAMTWNFFLNNALTFGDRRKRGLIPIVVGLISFYLICSFGTLANVGVAKIVYQADPSWWRAGLAGAAMAAVFNYAVTSTLTWRK